jgi:hypothetical protein
MIDNKIRFKLNFEFRIFQIKSRKVENGRKRKMMRFGSGYFRFVFIFTCSSRPSRRGEAVAARPRVRGGGSRKRKNAREAEQMRRGGHGQVNPGRLRRGAALAAG